MTTAKELLEQAKKFLTTDLLMDGYRVTPARYFTTQTFKDQVERILRDPPKVLTGLSFIPAEVRGMPSAQWHEQQANTKPKRKAAAA